MLIASSNGIVMQVRQACIRSQQEAPPVARMSNHQQPAASSHQQHPLRIPSQEPQTRAATIASSERSAATQSVFRTPSTCHRRPRASTITNQQRDRQDGSQTATSSIPPTPNKPQSHLRSLNLRCCVWITLRCQLANITYQRHGKQ